MKAELRVLQLPRGPTAAPAGRRNERENARFLESALVALVGSIRASRVQVLKDLADLEDRGRRAASTFRLMPPTGTTCPDSVISPVMARSRRTGRPVNSDTRAATIASPPDVPSF